ncbi:MAG: hypothetical protein ABF608_09250, partial [Sporolactobacillus sp.]
RRRIAGVRKRRNGDARRRKKIVGAKKRRRIAGVRKRRNGDARRRTTPIVDGKRISFFLCKISRLIQLALIGLTTAGKIHMLQKSRKLRSDSRLSENIIPIALGFAIKCNGDYSL